MDACRQVANVERQNFSNQELDAMANVLARIVTVFSVADGTAAVKPLGERELRGSVFSDGARVIRFADGRPPITHLVVTRTALGSALQALKGAGFSIKR